jgi:5-methylcytosine-specific restriction endonuclease McrA
MIHKGCAEGISYGTHKNHNEEPCKNCLQGRKKYLKEYRKKNREKLRQIKKQWRDEKHEEQLNKDRVYRKRNADKIKKYMQEWRLNNKEISNSHSRKKRAIKFSVNTEPYTIQDIIDSYGTSCHICLYAIDLDASRATGKGDWELSLHLDHVVPLSKGGEDNIINVKPSHAICNLIKGNKIGVTNG